MQQIQNKRSWLLTEPVIKPWNFWVSDVTVDKVYIGSKWDWTNSCKRNLSRSVKCQDAEMRESPQATNNKELSLNVSRPLLALFPWHLLLAVWYGTTWTCSVAWSSLWFKFFGARHTFNWKLPDHLNLQKFSSVFRVT